MSLTITQIPGTAIHRLLDSPEPQSRDDRAGLSLSDPTLLTAARDAEAEFLANLPVIEEVIRFTVRRYRCRPEDAEEFASRAKLKLIAEDYLVFRKFSGRSSLRTYLATVLQHLFLDYRIQHWGRWRPSTRARQLGATALRLESLLSRDGRSFDEACEILRVNEGAKETPSELAQIAAQLPVRYDRRPEPEEKPEVIGVPSDTVEAPARAGERQLEKDRIHAALQGALEELTPQDRLIVRLRFQEGMPPRQITRALGLETKPLYRRIEHILERLRGALKHEGIHAADVHDALNEYGLDLGSVLTPNWHGQPEVSS
jgi:RNA polymerase sigma factor (sigma-70 family)